MFDCFDLFLERQQFLIGQRAFAASDLIPFAEVDQCRRRADHITVEHDGLYEYELKFYTPELRGEMKFNPENGALMEKELKYQVR